MSESWSETRDANTCLVGSGPVRSGLVWFGPCPSSGIWAYLIKKIFINLCWRRCISKNFYYCYYHYDYFWGQKM